MNFMQQFLLFLVGCIGLRSLFVYLAYLANTTYLRYMGYVAIFPAIGHLYLFFNDTRKTGAFGSKLWWNHLRPIHGLLYFLFAYTAIQGNHRAWVYLLLDVILGLIVYLHFHSKHIKHLLDRTRFIE